MTSDGKDMAIGLSAMLLGMLAAAAAGWMLAGAFGMGGKHRVGAAAATDGAHRDASMRPQLITAENRPRASQSAHRRSRFNEAAAYHCGKPAHGFIAGGVPAASMRPQLITAENGLRD